MKAREKVKEIIIREILKRYNATIDGDRLLIYPPYDDTPALKEMEEDEKCMGCWEGYLELFPQEEMLGLTLTKFLSLANRFRILCHCKFEGELAKSAAEGARKLAHLRPQGQLRFYTFYSTAYFMQSERYIDEILILEELLQRGEVWTADLYIADGILTGDATEDEYLETLKKIDSTSNVPIYRHWVPYFLAPVQLITNEFMLVLEE